MAIFLNPFIVSGKIPEPYFCDRLDEAQQLLMSIENQLNVVLTSAITFIKPTRTLHLKPSNIHIVLSKA